MLDAIARNSLDFINEPGISCQLSALKRITDQGPLPFGYRLSQVAPGAS